MFRDSTFQPRTALTITVCVIASYLWLARRSRGREPQAVLIRRVLLVLCVAGGLLLYSGFLLPSTPTLSTFGCPDEVQDVDSPEEVLNYLQRYNRELVRTVLVLESISKVLVLTVVFGLISALYEYRVRTTVVARSVPADLDPMP